MAHHKSALKRIKQNERQRLRNRSVKTNTRSATRKVRDAVDAKDLPTAKESLLSAIGKLNSAASKGIIPKKRASRLVSRLTKTVNRAQ